MRSVGPAGAGVALDELGTGAAWRDCAAQSAAIQGIAQHVGYR